jgi:hypothetical protein
MRAAFLAVVLVTSPAWAGGKKAVRPRPAAADTAPKAAGEGAAAKSGSEAAATAAKKPAPAQTTKKARLQLDGEVVRGEQQAPKVNYVLPANVDAVRDAANKIGDDHLEAQRRK